MSTINPVTPPVLTPVPYNPEPYANLTPFTYKSARTWAKFAEDLRHYINVDLIPNVDGSNTALVEEFKSNVEALITDVNGALDSQAVSVNDAITAVTEYVNDEVQAIIGNSVGVQDPVLAGILENSGSVSRGVFDNLVNQSVDGRIGYINVANYPTIQEAIDAAQEGDRLFFPPELSPVTTATGFVLKTNNLTVDAMGVEFRVTTWGTPLFLASRENNAGDGHTIRIGKVVYAGVRGNHLGNTIRGSAPYCSGCAFWTNGDRNYVEYVRTDGMPTPVFFSSWDGTSASDRVGVGNRIGYLEAARYNFALLFVAQRGWDFGNAYCHDDLDDSGGANPTHAIYGSANENFRSPGGTMGRWIVENNNGGAPFQFKFTDGIKADILTANNSAGIASIQNCHDFAVNAMIGYGVKPAIPGSRIIELVGAQGCKRPNIGRVLIDKAPADRGESVILILDEGGYVGSITVTSRNTVDVGAEIAVRGVGTFVVPTILVTALNVPSRPVRLGNGTDAGKAVGWDFPNVRSVGGGVAYDPIPVEEYAQGYSNKWGDGNAYLSGAMPNRGIFRRGMRWGSSAPAVGAPRGWYQTVNGAFSKGAWAAGMNVAVGDWYYLTNDAVIRYYTAGVTGAAQPAGLAVGEQGLDGTAAYTVMSLTKAVAVSEGNL